MKRILIIAVIGGISFIAGYFSAKRRTENRLDSVLDEMCDALDRGTELLEENKRFMDEIMGPTADEDDDNKEDFCYDE